jgi:outer membrane protein OmpA-like peptidoglycan-associated protein
VPEVPPPPPAPSASRSSAERRFIGDPPPASTIPPPPEPVDVERVAPAAGTGLANADPPADVAPAKQPPAAKATPAPSRTERRAPARAAPDTARSAVPAPPKIPEPVQAANPPRQIARATPPSGATDMASAAPGPGGDQIRLGFAAGASEIDPSGQRRLDGVAQNLAQDPKLRLQLLAYAGGTSDTGNQARRLSLSRALSVRSYLMDKGVPSTRIDVRALGNKIEDGPPDRVDVVVTQR